MLFETHESAIKRCARKIMNLAAYLGLATICLVTTAYGDTWRCGTRLITLDDLMLQVREKCGEPISIELIGYTLRPPQRGGDGIEREFKIEQWIYGPEQGYYHVLRFEGGRLRNIDNVRQ